MSRIINFDNNLYYHIFNRGVDKRRIFMDEWDYRRFLESIREFNRVKPIKGLYRLHFEQQKEIMEFRSPTPYRESDSEADTSEADTKLIRIIAYCLNPNHYHLILKQETQKGISKFTQKISTGYTNYFNNKYKRSGSLFQGKYKAREIKSTYDLLKMSVYVNCNAEIHNIAPKEKWVWSSYKEYVMSRGLTAPLAVEPLSKQEVLDNMNTEEYIKLCNDLIPDIQKIKNLEKYNLE